MMGPKTNSVLEQVTHIYCVNYLKRFSYLLATVIFSLVWATKEKIVQGFPSYYMKTGKMLTFLYYG